MLGNGRLEAQCFDGERRLAHIRGKLRKKVWINQGAHHHTAHMTTVLARLVVADPTAGDIILLSLRDYQDEKGDVILKYSADEARLLKLYKELPDHAKINETDTYAAEGDEGIGIEFDDERDEEEDKDIDVDEI